MILGLVPSVEFNNYDENVEESQCYRDTRGKRVDVTESNDVPTAETTEEMTDETTTDETSEALSEEAPVSPVSEIVLPNNLKLITFEYLYWRKVMISFVLFVEEVENINRIIGLIRSIYLHPGRNR